LIRRSLESIARTWLAGLLLLLPLALTLAALAWVFRLLDRFIGPGSFVGRMFAWLGYPFTSNPGLQYVFGTLVLIGFIYLLGLIVESGMKGPLKGLGAGVLRRIPLIGGLYGVADKVVGMLDQKQGADIRAMRPVWCFFGGEGVAVLALAPNAEVVEIDGRSYLGVLIPTAPVPIGGALLYVPAEWVKAANIGVDKLTAVYVSMGITPPSQER
jgi:uncharacterized membrane protein